MWGFAFHPYDEFFLRFPQDNTYENATRYARFCAWHSHLLGDDLDHQVISRYNFEQQRIEYDVTLVLTDLRRHDWWNSEKKIEATIYAS
jgi:hypothetical protein